MSKECTCTEAMQRFAMEHVAGCKECTLDADGDIEPCEEYWKTIMGFEPGRSIAIWRDGRFQHYDVRKAEAGEL